MELFQVRPMDFLVKPIREEKINEIMKKGIELLGKFDSFFVYKKSHGTYKVPLKEIIYFEGRGRQVKPKADTVFYDSLKAILERSPVSDFFSVHKGYIVNYHHIVKFGSHELEMSNGDIVPIGYAKQQVVKAMQIRVEMERIQHEFKPL